jgi:hypothetical protein
MADSEFRKEWEQVMSDFPQFFVTDEQKWRSKREALIRFWKEKKRNPAKRGEDKELGKWLDHQKQDYKNKTKIMAYPEFRKEWEHAMLQFAQFCLSDEEAFAEKCTRFKTFVLEHNRKPKKTKEFKDERTLCKWFYNTNRAYEAKQYNMAKDDFRKMWEQLVADLNVLQ